MNRLLPQGYKIVHEERTTGRGRGVAVVYRETVNLKSVQQSKFESFEYIECCIHGSSMLRLCVLYRPPGHSGVTKFCEEFNDFASHALPALGLPLIVGDFNYHVNKSDNHEASVFMGILDSLDLHQHVNDATHRNGNTLDLVITRSHDDFIASCESHDCGFPDHFPVFLKLNLKKPALPKKSVTFRRLKKVDPVVLNNRIQSCSFFSCDLPSTNLDELVSNYNTQLSAVVDGVTPLQTKTITIIYVATTPEELPKAISDLCVMNIREWLNHTVELLNERSK